MILLTDDEQNTANHLCCKSHVHADLPYDPYQRVPRLEEGLEASKDVDPDNLDSASRDEASTGEGQPKKAQRCTNLAACCTS